MFVSPRRQFGDLAARPAGPQPAFGDEFANVGQVNDIERLIVEDFCGGVWWDCEDKFKVFAITERVIARGAAIIILLA